MIRLCPKGHRVSARRCGICAQQREATRGSRQARGYDANHDRARRTLALMLPALCGYAPVTGCTTVLHAGERWVAAHVVDGQPEHGWMLACVRCNERAKRQRIEAVA